MKTIFEKSNGNDGINLTDKMPDLSFIAADLKREGTVGLLKLSELDVMCL